jgi:hypothetical protein
MDNVPPDNAGELNDLLVAEEGFLEGEDFQVARLLHVESGERQVAHLFLVGKFVVTELEDVSHFPQLDALSQDVGEDVSFHDPLFADPILIRSGLHLIGERL